MREPCPMKRPASRGSSTAPTGPSGHQLPAAQPEPRIRNRRCGRAGTRPRPPIRQDAGPGRTHQKKKDECVMVISVAEKVLIAGGMLNLAYGTLLGYPITVIRVKGAPATPKYPMAAHVSALLHAAILLGLAWAARLSTLGPGWLDGAAWLVVVSSALIAAKDTLNWLTGVQDEFSEKAKTAPLAAPGAVTEPIGTGIFL